MNSFSYTVIFKDKKEILSSVTLSQLLDFVKEKCIDARSDDGRKMDKLLSSKNENKLFFIASLLILREPDLSVFRSVKTENGIILSETIDFGVVIPGEKNDTAEIFYKEGFLPNHDLYRSTISTERKKITTFYLSVKPKFDGTEPEIKGYTSPITVGSKPFVVTSILEGMEFFTLYADEIAEISKKIQKLERNR